jgi:hypothetical protein
MKYFQISLQGFHTIHTIQVTKDKFLDFNYYLKALLHYNFRIILNVNCLGSY